MSEDATLDEFVEDGDGERHEFVETAAGKIPVDWDTVNVEELCELRNGKATDHTDIGEQAYLVYGSNGPIGSYSESNFGGGLIFGRVGAVGEVERIREPVWVSDNAIQATVNDRCNTDFLYYFLSNKELSSLATKTAQPLLNQSTIGNVSVPSPPIPEQRKIATVLYTVDRAIEKIKEIIDQIGTVKEGVEDDLLTSGIGDTETAETRLGPVSTKIPTHWDTRRIGDLFTDRQLGTGERGSTHDGENIDLIKMGNLNFGTWDLSEVEKIKKDPELLKEANLQRGDLLFNTRNTPELVGKAAVWEFDHEAVYDNNLLRLRFGERISSGHFVNAYLSSNIGRRQLRGRVHGTTSVAAIYWTDLQEVEIPVPPKGEQREIVDSLQELDTTRKHNETIRNRLQRLKQALQQDLLSGTVRTTDTNIEVPDEIAQHG